MGFGWFVRAEPNSGNGGSTDTYSWVQTLGDLNVTIPVPAGIKSKDLDVTISKKKLKVGLKGPPPIVDVRPNSPGTTSRFNGMRVSIQEENVVCIPAIHITTHSIRRLPAYWAKRQYLRWV